MNPGLVIASILLFLPSGCIFREEVDYGVNITTKFSFEMSINTTYNSSITLLLPVLMTLYNNQTEIHPVVNVSLRNNPDWNNHSFEKIASDTFINLTLSPSIRKTNLSGELFINNITEDEVFSDLITKKWISSVNRSEKTIKFYLLTKMSVPIEISITIMYYEHHVIHTAGNTEINRVETYNNPAIYGLNIFNITLERWMS